MPSRKKSTDASLPKAVYGPSDCYNFLTNNEYSDKTVGLPSFILRNTPGDNNVSDIFKEFENCIKQKIVIDYLAFLSGKLKKLPEIYASIEKCLVLGRLIKYIEETQQVQTNETPLAVLMSDIHNDMIRKITSDQSYPPIDYPRDFRQRENDFNRCRDAQDIRRLFYYPDAEAKIQNIIQLQNKITAHLSYIIDTKMRYDSSFRDVGLQEIKNIFYTSFMIITQPHNNTNPVVVYDGKRSESPTAKVSVIIVSLLHDFMVTHPNMIELENIELNLSSTSNFYKLNGSQKLSWKTCQLHTSPGERPRTIQYAELSVINIKQSSRAKKGDKPNEELYTFTFPIIIHLKSREPKISEEYKFPLQSLPFAISSHTDHISFFTAKVLINDIERISQIQSTPADLQLLKKFLYRYFIHRTGVEPKRDLRDYLEEELIKYNDARRNYQSLEDKFMDFLVEFVQQIEYMRKHPVLSMFYEDGLFLGPCKSELVEEIMTKLANVNFPIVALRFNCIKVDYAVNTSLNASKSMQATPCFVRVIIHNGRTDKPDDRTFDAKALSEDLLKFVSTSNEKKAYCVRILSTLNGAPNNTTFKRYTCFDKYFHPRLLEISEINPVYKDITDILIDISNTNDCVNENQNDSIPSTSTYKNISNKTANYDTNEPLLEFVPPKTDEELLEGMDPDVILKYILSNPLLFEKLQSYFLQRQISNATSQIQQPSSTIQNQFLPQFQEIPSSSSMSNLPLVYSYDDIERPSSQTQIFHIIQNSSIQSGQNFVDVDMLDQTTYEHNQQYTNDDSSLFDDQ